MHYATDRPVGTQMGLTVRDEDRIFGDMDRMMGEVPTIGDVRWSRCSTPTVWPAAGSCSNPR